MRTATRLGRGRHTGNAESASPTTPDSETLTVAAADGDVWQRLGRLDWAFMAALGALGLVLCLFQLASRGIAYDESVSVAVAQRSGLHGLARDGGEMWAYYLFLKAWTILGVSERVLRLPSALFSAATAPLLYFLGRRLFNRFVALSAGLLLVVNASFIRYAQYTRGFALEMLAIVASWLILTIALERRTMWWFTAYGLLAALAVAAHPLAIFVVAAQGASILLLEGRDLPWRNIVAGFVVAGALLLPLAVVAASKGGSQIAWIPPLSRAAVQRVLLFFGPTSPRFDHRPLVVGVYLVVWVSGAIAAARTLAHHGRGRASWAFGMPVLWLGVPVLLGIAMSATVHPLLVPRYFIGALPGAALLGGVALSRLPGRPLQAVALVSLLALAAVAIAGSYHTDDAGWREASDFVLNSTHSGDGVVVTPAWFRAPFEYYWELRNRPRPPEPVSPPQPWGLGLTHRLTASMSPAAAATAAMGHSRVWVVVSDWWLHTVRVDPKRRLVTHDKPGWDLAVFLRDVAPRFRVAASRRFPGVEVFLLEQPSLTPPPSA